MQLKLISKKKAFTYAILFSLPCLALSNDKITNSQAVISELKQELDVKAVDLLQTHDVPSVAVAYLAEGKVAWTAVYGEQGVNQPANLKTLYNIASMTKPITSEVVLRLIARNKIALDDPIHQYWIDSDVANNPWHKQLTPKIALSHQTGFPNWRSQTKGILTFNSEPGTKTTYSGEGYNYVARYVEKRLVGNFEDLATDTVFKPLNMLSTSYTKKEYFSGHVATPKGPNNEYGEPLIRSSWNAADDVYTTINDYAAFLASVMRHDELTTELIKQKFTIHGDSFRSQICAPNRVPDKHCPEQAGFGLGWTIFKYKKDTVIMHGGGDWGERTLALFVPEKQIGIVVFTNGAKGMKVIRDIVKLLYTNPDFDAFLEFQANS